jgi:hypothetical protein
LYIAVAGHLNRIIRTELDGTNSTMLHVNVSDPVGLSLSGEMLIIADRRYKHGAAETAIIKYNVLDETTVNEETKNIVSSWSVIILLYAYKYSAFVSIITKSFKFVYTNISR